MGALVELSCRNQGHLSCRIAKETSDSINNQRRVMWLACNGESHGGKCLNRLKSIHTINRLKIKPIYSNDSECVSPIVWEKVFVAAVGACPSSLHICLCDRLKKIVALCFFKRLKHAFFRNCEFSPLLLWNMPGSIGVRILEMQGHK